MTKIITETKEDKVVPITPEQSEKINKIVEKFADYLVKLANRDRKGDGGFVDKAIYYPNYLQQQLTSLRKKIRNNFDNGGMVHDIPEDEEGQTRYLINILTPPTNAWEAHIREQLELDLQRMQKTRGK